MSFVQWSRMLEGGGFWSTIDDFFHKKGMNNEFLEDEEALKFIKETAKTFKSDYRPVPSYLLNEHTGRHRPVLIYFNHFTKLRRQFGEYKAMQELLGRMKHRLVIEYDSKTTELYYQRRRLHTSME